MTLIQKIRTSVNNNIKNSLFVYGRNSDTALESAKVLNVGTFVYLEPINKSFIITDSFYTCSITIGFLTQDEPDSESDEELNEDMSLSMETKVADMETIAIEWLNTFVTDDNFTINTVTMQPVFRIKNVMTGVLLTFDLIEPKQC